MSIARLMVTMTMSYNSRSFRAIHKEFYYMCTSSFHFGQLFYTVDIVQCIPAKDEYIICKLENEIVKNVKAKLQMSDMNQRQKICLTPVDEEANC
jgi:hypothetical protein